MDPGQDQESRIVDHEREGSSRAVCERPSDEAVARGELPGGGGEAEHGQWPAVAVVDRRSASARRPGSCIRGSGSGRRTRSRAGLRGCRARRCACPSGRTSSRVVGAGSSGGSMSGPKTIGFGRYCRPLGGRQGDHAVAVHGEHGDPGHHVLEAAVGLDPADAAAELSRQGGAGRLWIGRDQGAQQRHLFNGEVASVIAALDRAAHRGAMNSRLRSSFIDHGSQDVRSSGGLPPFLAQAFNHASSQRRTSMPLASRACPRPSA